MRTRTSFASRGRAISKGLEADQASTSAGHVNAGHVTDDTEKLEKQKELADTVRRNSFKIQSAGKSLEPAFAILKFQHEQAVEEEATARLLLGDAIKRGLHEDEVRLLEKHLDAVTTLRSMLTVLFTEHQKVVALAKEYEKIACEDATKADAEYTRLITEEAAKKVAASEKAMKEKSAEKEQVNAKVAELEAKAKEAEKEAADAAKLAEEKAAKAEAAAKAVEAEKFSAAMSAAKSANDRKKRKKELTREEKKMVKNVEGYCESHMGDGSIGNPSEVLEKLNSPMTEAEFVEVKDKLKLWNMQILSFMGTGFTRGEQAAAEKAAEAEAAEAEAAEAEAAEAEAAEAEAANKKPRL